ncbi:hypothetical protein E2320_012169, partial [Naja naja]
MDGSSPILALMCFGRIVFPGAVVFLDSHLKVKIPFSSCWHLYTPRKSSKGRDLNFCASDNPVLCSEEEERRRRRELRLALGVLANLGFLKNYPLLEDTDVQSCFLNCLLSGRLQRQLKDHFNPAKNVVASWLKKNQETIKLCYFYELSTVKVDSLLACSDTFKCISLKNGPYLAHGGVLNGRKKTWMRDTTPLEGKKNR